MTAGPHDSAAAGRDRLRVGHADREHVIETLKVAFVHGRMTKDEFDTRTGQALVARTRADLAALTADIPPVPAAARTARRSAPARSRPLAKASAASGGLLAFAFGLILFAANVLDPHGLGNPYHPWSSLCAVVAMFATIAAVMVFVHGVGTSVEQRRARRQLWHPGPDSASKTGACGTPAPRVPPRRGHVAPRPR